MGRCPVRSIFPQALDMLKKKQHLLGSVHLQLRCPWTRPLTVEIGSCRIKLCPCRKQSKVMYVSCHRSLLIFPRHLERGMISSEPSPSQLGPSTKSCNAISFEWRVLNNPTGPGLIQTQDLFDKMKVQKGTVTVEFQTFSLLTSNSCL